MRHRLLLALVVCLLAIAAGEMWGSQARAAVEPSLALVPTHYVGHPVDVNCDPEDAMEGAWGYTMPLVDTGNLWMEDDLCAALTVPDSAEDWRTALAILVLTHESWHLVPWRHALDEARVECAAIRRWHETAGLLGFDEVTQARLWPWALVAHYHLGYQIPAYQHRKCKVPGWPPWSAP